MNTISLINQLFHHMHWADSLMWESVLKTAATKEDHAIRERLHHIHLCQNAWLQIWHFETVDPKTGESLDIAGLSRWARQFHESVLKYVEELDELDLERAVDVPGAENESIKPNLAETIIQITSHSTYHRGQVSMRLRELEGEPNETDFIRWVWLGKPEAEWPTG